MSISMFGIMILIFLKIFAKHIDKTKFMCIILNVDAIERQADARVAELADAHV